MSTSVNPYDEVPYGEASYTQTHPNRTATIATLLGLNPAPVERCRVLELGSAGGANIIPMAYELPESQFVGVDYSARQVEAGQAMIRALGLTNVELRAMDVRDINESFGQFDYIIAHGLYSWVPQEVREQVLVICKQNLAPEGIAYVSYNTYPGWHMFEVVRNAMRFRTRGIDEPQEKAQAARDFIEFLADSPLTSTETPWSMLMHAYTTLMQVESEYLNHKPPSVMLHDELEVVNAPCYFYEFVERSESHGLEYLAESHFPYVMPANLPQSVAQGIGKISDSLVEIEQYMDFVRNRTFRQTLLCHQGTAIDRRLKIDRVHNLYVSSPARVGELDQTEQKPGAEKFIGADGLSFVTTDPIMKAAFHCLIENYPQIVRLDDLLEAVRAQVYAYRVPSTTPEADMRTLATQFLQAYTRSIDMIELHSYRPRFVSVVSERPVMSAVAREQAKRTNVVTTMRHENAELDNTSIFLASYLDGTNDRAALLEKLKSAVVLPAGESLKPETEAGITKELETTLDWLTKGALLVG
jgi:methyltransferase-like protein/predicted O-methyltransferase YrrM